MSLDLPDSLDFRLIDVRAFQNLANAIQDEDRSGLNEICSVAAARLKSAEFRGSPGRMSRIGWASRDCENIEHFARTVIPSRSATESEFSDLLSIITEPLIASYAMPFFQSDYVVSIRTSAQTDWLSTKTIDDDGMRLSIYRELTESNSIKVKVAVPSPCSFVSLGFLDGGVYASLLRERGSDVQRLLAKSKRVRPQYADIMWIAKSDCLQEFTEILENGGNADLLGLWTFFRREAEARGYDIAITGWYGASVRSTLAPAEWICI